jgi:DeoR/GlpR family transcriptional regulator of sugar metabolism
MFAEERQNQIVALVNKNGSVRVKELSEKYQVTEDSIRKDLTFLEKKGLLKKTYGGAMKKRINVHDLNVSQRKDKNIEAKQKIAAKAMELIKDGDMVFLDISTANLELAKLITKSSLNITVVTNMVDIMLEFMVPATARLIFIGGAFSIGKDGFVGSFTNKQISEFRFDIAFLGTVGVDVFENNVSTYMVEDGLTKSAVLEVSKNAYMMLETRKFNTDGTYKYARIDSFTGAVMESKPPSEIEEKLKELNIEWL